MAIGHAPFIRAIFFSLAIGGFFLISTIIFIVGAVFIASGKLSKLSNFGLIAMSIIDEVLLVYTRTMPNVFFHRIVPWSWNLFPLGTVEILVGQALLVVLCAVLYKSK
jgi:hypothetical protein